MNEIDFDGKKVVPSKVVCVGRNYAEHAAELGNEIPAEPVLFIKPNSAVSGELHLPHSAEVQYEAEICFLVHSEGLAGVGFGLDLTKRGVQSGLKEKGLPWERAKAFDGAAVFSGFVAFEGPLDEFRLELWINDTLHQAGGVADMLHRPEQLVLEVAANFSWEDGDILMTGTPKGVGPVVMGDRYVGKIFNRDRLLIEFAATAA